MVNLKKRSEHPIESFELGIKELFNFSSSLDHFCPHFTYRNTLELKGKSLKINCFVM